MRCVCHKKIEIRVLQRSTITIMCSICRNILIGFSIKHDELMCPIRNGLYCSTCARYGHLHTQCPTLEERSIRIVNSEEAIREFLLEQGIICKKNPRKVLYHYADMNHMRIVYIV